MFALRGSSLDTVKTNQEKDNMTTDVIRRATEKREKDLAQSELVLDSLESFKDSLYSRVYNLVQKEAKQGDFQHLSTNNAALLQVLDDRSYVPEKGKRPSPPNDLKKYVMKVRPNATGEGVWYRYDGVAWVEEPTNMAESIFHTIVGAVYNAYNDLNSDGDLIPPQADDKAIKTINKKISDYKDLKENNRPQKDSIAFITNYLTIPYDPFNSSQYLIMSDGAILDLKESSEKKELTFVSVGPEAYIHSRYRTNFKYIPGSTPGPAMHHYLSTSPVDYDTGVNMCRALACGLFSFKPKKFFSLIEMYGESNTGKSMILEAVIGQAIPGLTTPVNEDHFGRRPNNFALGDIIGKRVLTMAEYSGTFSDSRIKSATGKDTMRTDVKYKGPVFFVFDGVIAITSNSSTGTKLPLTDPGIRERLFPIPFPHKIVDGKYMDENGVTTVWEGEDLKETALPAENDTTLSWMLDLWIEQEKKDTFRIQRTEAQEKEIALRTGEADLFNDFLADMERDNGWTYDPDADGKDMVRISVVQPKYAAWLNDQGYNKKQAPADMARLVDEGRAGKKTGQKRLFNWVENSHTIRNSIVSDQGLTKGM